MLLEQRQTLLRGGDGHRWDRPAAQQRLEQLPAARGVFDDQHRPSVSVAGGARAGTACCASVPNRAVKTKVVPTPGVLSKVRSPPIRRDEPSADCQAEAGPAVVARRGGVGLRERLEQLSLLLLRDADPGIAHRHAQVTWSGVVVRGGHGSAFNDTSP